jgi:rubrerythrin
MTTSATGSRRLTELPASPWDEQLLAHFEEHVRDELTLIEEYLGFRERGPEYVRYLIDLILNDESRHHQMFKELLNHVRSGIDYRDYGPQVPYMQASADDREALLEATDRFLAFERADEKSLRRLAKDLRPVRDTTLFSLLVELMELDTKKHVAILEFIRRSAQHQPW